MSQIGDINTLVGTLNAAVQAAAQSAATLNAAIQDAQAANLKLQEAAAALAAALTVTPATS